MSSRKIEDLVPELQTKCLAWCDKCRRQGLSFKIICTKRQQTEQDALYAQGRTTPGQIVTWTRKSKHVEGKAFDFVVIKNDKISWVDADYTPYGLIAEDLGLQWGIISGGKRKDFGHIQLRDDDVS